MSHDCHHCDHEHEHNDQHLKKAFTIGIGLNLIFTFVEFFYGYFSHSLSLMSDAGHNLSDVLGLLLAFVATIFASKKATKTFTFGTKKLTILAALLNGLALLLVCGGIIYSAFYRFQSPAAIETNSVMIVAGIGMAINFISAQFFKTHHHDLNAKGAYLHLIGDAAISLAVLLGALAIKYTGLVAIDSILSIIISLVIAYSSMGLFKESFFQLIHAVPNNISLEDISHKLSAQHPDIISFHDLHVWALSSTQYALTVHIVIDTKKDINQDQLLITLEKFFEHEFHITHATIQIEQSLMVHKNHSQCYMPPL